MVMAHDFRNSGPNLLPHPANNHSPGVSSIPLESTPVREISGRRISRRYDGDRVILGGPSETAKPASDVIR